MRLIFLSLLLLLTMPMSEVSAQSQQGAQSLRAQSLRRSKCLRGWPMAMRQNNLLPSDRGEWLRRCRSGVFDSHQGSVR
jgi:hypothetical protein